MNSPKLKDQLRQSPSHDARGFTLTELLVIVVMLLFLALTLKTAVPAARPNTQTYQCLNNLRQLGIAWRIYAEDNQGQLVYNASGSGAGTADQSWCGGWLDFSLSPDNTNTDLLINHSKYPRSAFLGPYLKTATVFKCPADRSTHASTPVPRARSVSLNNFMGINSHAWTTPTLFTVYSKLNQLRSPSSLFLFLDERFDSINDAFFWTDPDIPFHMVDYPGSYHERSGNFIFADNHGETHRWTDPRTTPPLNQGQLLPLNISLPGNPDVTWLQQHASERR